MTATTWDAPVAPTTKHTLATSVALHLFPGAVLVILYLFLAPLGMKLGLPPLLTSCALAVTVLGPLEIGHLLRIARRNSGRWSLRGAVDLPPPMKLWRYVVITLGLVAASIAVYAVSLPADRWFGSRIMGLLPSWYDFFRVDPYRHLGAGVLVALLVLRFLADVVVTSTAEELYFRGYLLPRIPGPAWLAPIINAALFAIYHFWQPYNWPSIFCFTLPMILAVWRTKDVRLSIATHVTMNLIGFVAFAAAVLRP